MAEDNVQTIWLHEDIYRIVWQVHERFTQRSHIYKHIKSPYRIIKREKKLPNFDVTNSVRISCTCQMICAVRISHQRDKTCSEREKFLSQKYTRKSNLFSILKISHTIGSRNQKKILSLCLFHRCILVWVGDFFYCCCCFVHCCWLLSSSSLFDCAHCWSSGFIIFEVTSLSIRRITTATTTTKQRELQKKKLRRRGV